MTACFRFAALTLGALLTACLPAARPNADPQAAAAHLQEAATRAAAGDYRGAAGEVGLASVRTVADPGLFLLQGALLERAADPDGARDAYRTGLRQLGSDHPRRRELAWRLGLLYALKLDAPFRAWLLLRHLPSNTVERADLLGVLALRKGDLAAARAHLEGARQQAREDDLAAAVSYHLALVHSWNGDRRSALGDLYRAAGRTRNHGLLGDIDGLWRILSAAPPAKQ